MAEERSRGARRVERMQAASLVILFLVGPFLKLSLVPWPVLVVVLGVPLLVLVNETVTLIARSDGVSRGDVFARGLRRRRPRGKD